MTSYTPPVSSLSIIFMCITLLICFGVPIGLAVRGKVKYKKAFSFIPLCLGAAGFIIFQYIIRIHFMLPLIQSSSWFKSIIIMPWVQWLYVAFLCITAGLFEEPVRFAVFSILKKSRQFPNSLSYGIGHGGIEAIPMVGLIYINNVSYSLMINSDLWGTIMETVPAAMREQYANVPQQLISVPPDMFLLGGLERLFTIAIQIAFSVIIVKGFMVNKKWLYLILATILHALVDFSAVSLQILKVNPWIIEGVIFVEAVIALLYIIRQAKDWRKNLNQSEEVAYGQPRQTNTP